MYRIGDLTAERPSADDISRSDPAFQADFLKLYYEFIGNFLVYR